MLSVFMFIGLSSATILDFFIASDISNFVQNPSNTEGFAIVVEKKSTWTASVVGANWIWDSKDGNTGIWKFSKYFFVAGITTTAKLTIAAEGVFTTLLNYKNIVCDDNIGDTYSKTKTCDLDASVFYNGINLFEVNVTNSNFGTFGLLYQLAIKANYV